VKVKRGKSLVGLADQEEHGGKWGRERRGLASIPGRKKGGGGGGADLTRLSSEKEGSDQTAISDCAGVGGGKSGSGPFPIGQGRGERVKEILSGSTTP